MRISEVGSVNVASGINRKAAANFKVPYATLPLSNDYFIKPTSFKGDNNAYFTQAEIKDEQLTGDYNTLECNNIILYEKRFIDTLKANYKKVVLQYVGNVELRGSIVINNLRAVGNVTMESNSFVDNSISRGIIIRGQARVNDVVVVDEDDFKGKKHVTHEAVLKDKAKVKSVKAPFVEIDDDSHADLVTSPKIELKGSSTVEMIEGGEATLKGNSNVKFAKCDKLRLEDNAHLNGSLEIPDLENIVIKQTYSGDTIPYINPYLIKIPKKNFDPTSLTYWDNESRTQKAYMPKTILFEEPFEFINNNNAKDIESSSYLLFKDNSFAENVLSDKKITLKDDASLTSASSREIELNDNSNINLISGADNVMVRDRSSVGILDGGAAELFGSSKVSKIDVINLVLNDNVVVRDAKSRNLNLKNNASIFKEATALNAKLLDNSKIEKLNLIQSEEQPTAELSLSSNSMIDTVVADTDVILKGNGVIQSLLINKNSKIVIEGPIRVNKIEFIGEKGTIVVVKNSAGDFCKLDESKIKNANIQYRLAESKMDFDYKNFFNHRIRNFENSINTRKSIPQLGNYSDLATLVASNPDYKDKINKIIANSEQKNLETVENLYYDYINETIADLAKGNSKTYTTFWIKNKQIGNIPIADFWMKKLGIETKNLSTKEKTNIVNNLSEEQKASLIESTTNYWVDEILVKELRGVENVDLKTISDDIKIDGNLNKIILLLKKGKQQKLIDEVEQNGLVNLKFMNIGSQNIVDFWIDTIDGEDISSHYSENQKQQRIQDILKDKAQNPLLVNSVEEYLNNLKSKLDFAKNTFDTLIDEDELNNITHTKILNEYKESSLFYDLSNTLQNELKGIKTPFGFQFKIKDEIIPEVDQERIEIIRNARENIFAPIKNMKDIASNPDNEKITESVDFLFGLYADEIKKAPNSRESMIIKEKISRLYQDIAMNSDDVEKEWKGIVDNAQSLYETNVVKDYLKNSIYQLNNIKNDTRHNWDPAHIRLIDSKNLNIAKRDFVSRHYQSLRPIFDQPVNDLNTDLDDLIASENLAVATFDFAITDFLKKISQQSVEKYDEIADLFVQQLGFDPLSLKASQKADVLSSVSTSELLLVRKYVEGQLIENQVKSFVDSKIKDKIAKNNIVSELKLTNKTLAEINQRMFLQNANLVNLANNIDSYAKTFQQNQNISIAQINGVLNRLERINIDTSDIKATAVATLCQAAASSNDVALQQEILNLLPEKESTTFATFINKYNQRVGEMATSMEAKRENLKELAIIGGMLALTVTGAVLTGGASTSSGGAMQSIGEVCNMLNRCARDVFFATNMYSTVSRKTTGLRKSFKAIKRRI